MNKKDLYNANRRQKYAEDNEYREQVRAARRARYTKSVTNNRKVNMPTEGDGSGINGRFTIIDVADNIGFSVASVRRWIRNDMMPSPETSEGYTYNEMRRIVLSFNLHTKNTFGVNDFNLINNLKDGMWFARASKQRCTVLESSNKLNKGIV